MSDLLIKKLYISVGVCGNALAVFKQSLESHAVNLSKCGFIVTLEYVKNAVIKHYHLCHYFLFDEQKVCKYQAQLTVHSSDGLQALAASMKLDHWKIHEQLEKMEQSQELNKKIVKEEQEVLLDKARADLRNLYQGCVDKLKESEIACKCTVLEVIEGESACVLAEIQQRVTEQEMDLDFHVKKLEILNSQTRNDTKPSTPRVVSGTIPKKK